MPQHPQNPFVACVFAPKTMTQTLHESNITFYEKTAIDERIKNRHPMQNLHFEAPPRRLAQQQGSGSWNCGSAHLIKPKQIEAKNRLPRRAEQRMKWKPDSCFSQRCAEKLPCQLPWLFGSSRHYRSVFASVLALKSSQKNERKPCERSEHQKHYLPKTMQHGIKSATITYTTSPQKKIVCGVCFCTKNHDTNPPRLKHHLLRKNSTSCANQKSSSYAKSPFRSLNRTKTQP